MNIARILGWKLKISPAKIILKAPVVVYRFFFIFCLPNCRCHALIKLCLLMNIGRISWCCPTFLSHVENSALKKIGLHLLMYWWNLALVQTSFGSIASDDLKFFYLLSYWCTWRNLGFSPYNARYYMGDTQDW